MPKEEDGKTTYHDAIRGNLEDGRSTRHDLGDETQALQLESPTPAVKMCNG